MQDFKKDKNKIKDINSIQINIASKEDILE